MSAADRFSASLLRLLKRYGSPVVLKRPQAPAYDVATGEATEGAAISHTVYGHLTRYKQSVVDGTRIRSSDFNLRIQPFGHTPTPEWEVVVGTVTYVVVTVLPILVNGVAVGFDLQVRA